MVAAPTDYAWAAGILDGEGCILLERRQQGRNPTFVLRVIVANTDPAMLTRLREIFGVGAIHPRRYANPRNRPSWAWHVCSRQAETVLRAVLPYLVTKREQAESGLLSRRLMNASGAGLRSQNPNLDALERMADDIKAMKKRPGE